MYAASAASEANRNCSPKTWCSWPSSRRVDLAVYDFTRTDQFTIAPCRHPMGVSVTAAARSDGVLTALSVSVLSDAGAYGNHSAGVMFHGCNESVTLYRCRNKHVDEKPCTPTIYRRERFAATGSDK